MTTTTPLSREDFRQWLVSKKPDEVVGLAGDAKRCPYAAYATSVPWGSSFCDLALVGRGGVQLFWRDEVILSESSPRWLQDFMRRADARTYWITAKDALTILDGIDG